MEMFLWKTMKLVLSCGLVAYLLFAFEHLAEASLLLPRSVTPPIMPSQDLVQLKTDAPRPELPMDMLNPLLEKRTLYCTDYVAFDTPDSPPAS